VFGFELIHHQAVQDFTGRR